MLLRKLLPLLIVLLSAPAFAAPNGEPPALTAGHTEIVLVAFYDGQGKAPHVCMPAENCGGSALPGVTDAVGSKYRRIGIVQAPNHVFLEVWTATIAGNCFTDCLIAVHSSPSGEGTAPAIEFLQYSGVAAVDLAGMATDSGASATSAILAVPTSNPDSFVVGAIAEHAEEGPTMGTLISSGCTPRGPSTSNDPGTVELASCDISASPPATAVGMTFPRAAWSGIAVELCTTNPCEEREASPGK